MFDKKHNDYFVFGGLIFLSSEDRDVWCRKYSNVENVIRQEERIPKNKEIKASSVSVKSKYSLFRSLKNADKFCAVISQKKLSDKIFLDKKNKQRYLDWAYKMAVKKKLQDLLANGSIRASEVENIYFFVDEHTTATSGIYELKESLEQEFKRGRFNYEWSFFHPPLFEGLKSITVKYVNSEKCTLVRAADIIANHFYYLAYTNNGIADHDEKTIVYYHPTDYIWNG